MNVEIGRQNIIILFSNNEATEFHFWEYIQRMYIQTLKLQVEYLCNTGFGGLYSKPHLPLLSRFKS
jgi:hypothetical protein